MCGPSKVQRYGMFTFLVSNVHTFEPNIRLIRLILIMQNPECHTALRATTYFIDNRTLNDPFVRPVSVIRGFA